MAFGQTLNGKPVYWAALNNNGQGEGNRAELVVDDEGLYTLSIKWSQFIPTNNPKETLGEEKALQAFRALGIKADAAESCYLLRPLSGKYTAIPAYRYRNSYIHAITGEQLQ